MGPRAEKKILISLYINLCINLEFYFGNDLQTHFNTHEGPAKSGKMSTDFHVIKLHFALALIKHFFSCAEGIFINWCSMNWDTMPTGQPSPPYNCLHVTN